MDKYGKAKSSLRKPDIKPCYCTGAVKKQLSAVAWCSDDLAAVSALPVQWVPTHCGPTLTNYLKEREQNHHKTLEDLLSDAAKVNKDINAKIRDISEILLSHIKENQNDIDCVVQKFHLKRGVGLSVEARNEALKEIDKLFTVRIQDLAKFKQEALGLERERVEGIRSTMKVNFQRLIAIGHKTPKDLLHDFDDKMYEINAQLLSNSRAYIELEAQLRVQLEESMVRARSTLNQMCLKKSEIVRGRSALPWTKNQSSHKKSDNADDKIVDKLGDSSQGVVVNIEEFNACVAQIVEAYRKAILKVFSEFSSNLDDLQRDIGFHSLKTDKNRSSAVNLELDSMIGRAIKRISDSSIQIKGSVYKDLEEMAHNDVQHMQQSLISLGNCLRDTYKILFDASHIWDDHILRSALVQKLTVAAVEDMQNIHDATELANEINFNITLEQLRYAPDVDKLQHSFDSALNLLKGISDMNLRHSESEISKLEEYMNLPAIMAKVLLAECDVFLENHPKTVLERSGSFTSPASIRSTNYRSAFSLRAPLPRAILQTELQEVALNNWKNGFIDSFVYNLPNVSQEMNRQARKWVDERRLQLNTRYSLKCMSHSIREERVKTARETRLSELVFHEERLNSHLAAIYNRTEGLPYKASSYLALDAPELYPFSKWIKSIQTDIDDLLFRNPEQEVKKLKMMSYASRLVNHRKLFQESLDSAIEGYRKNLEHEIHVARIANFRFMSQLKLFFEGGRYAAGEATKTCAALVKAADALGACKQRCMDALNARRSQLLALADQQMLPAQRIVEEVYKSSKNGKKSLQLKKK